MVGQIAGRTDAVAEAGASVSDESANLASTVGRYSGLSLGAEYAQRGAEAIGADSLAEGIGGARESIDRAYRGTPKALAEAGAAIGYTAKNPGLALDDAAQSGLITGGTRAGGSSVVESRRLGGDGHAGGISLGRGGGGRLHGRRCGGRGGASGRCAVRRQP